MFKINTTMFKKSKNAKLKILIKNIYGNLSFKCKNKVELK